MITPGTTRLRAPINPRQRVRAKGRAVFWFYIVLSALLLITEAIGSGVPRIVRGYANDLVLPGLILLEKPIGASQALLERLAGVSDLYLENQSLRDENEGLKQWQATAQQLARENESLRRILKVPARHIPEIATARIVGVGGGAFERSVIIDAGAEDGVRRNAPVLNESGLVGRVLDVGLLSSRILLITDLNSRIPVRVGASGVLAIVEGRNDRLLMLTFTNRDMVPPIGERLFTSGHGGRFPANIPLGKVVQNDSGNILVEPDALMERLDYLRVLDYQVPPPEAVYPGGDTPAEGEKQ